MKRFIQGPVREQRPLSTKPYDRWITPDGETTAEFRRTSSGYLVRFPDTADFVVDHEAGSATGYPASEATQIETRTLFRNAISPVMGNHRGELHLHASAVRIGARAIAFVGSSRSGKTTLAAAFARAGFAAVTEDVLALETTGAGYRVAPGRPVVRLFPDSAAELFGTAGNPEDENAKREYPAGTAIPFETARLPLAAIFLLEEDASESVQIAPVLPPTAMARLVPQSFILDVEDRHRMRGHFARLGQLAESVPCYALDYPRRYDALNDVIGAVRDRMENDL